MNPKRYRRSVGALAMKLSKGKERLLLLFSMLSVGLLSTVLSDTGTAAVAHAVVSLVDNPWMLQPACRALTAILTTS